MCKRLIVGLFFLMSATTYGLGQGVYLLGIAGISPGLYDRANIQVSSKMLGGGQFHYQWFDHFAVSCSILAGWPNTGIDSKYQSQGEGITIYSAIGDITGKLTLFSFSLPSLSPSDTNVYLQAGGGSAFAFSRSDKKAPWDIRGGRTLLGGFGFNTEIKSNILFDIAYNVVYPLNKDIQYTHLLKVGIGGRII